MTLTVLLHFTDEVQPSSAKGALASLNAVPEQGWTAMLKLKIDNCVQERPPQS